MRRWIARLIIMLAALGAGSGPLAAQAWEAPSFFSPRQHDDIGVYGFVPDGGDWGVSGIWRQSGNLNLGVRLGVVEENVLLGAEFYAPIRTGSQLLLSWLVGVGAGIGDDITQLRVPFGLSLGATLGRSGALQFTPYVHPRVAIDVLAIDVGDEEDTETELNFDIDLGVDLQLTPDWYLKVGGTVGENEAFGVGLAYRIQRRVEVR